MAVVDVDFEARNQPEFGTWLKAKLAPSSLDAQLLRVEHDTRPVVVFVLGGPGAGKGTQCERIVEHFGYTHISAGDCLRAERASGSADAELIESYIRDGKIVPVEITVKLLLKAMEGKSKVLIDGFPRNLDNLVGWMNVVGTKARVAIVLFLDCPENVMEQRLIKRGETSGRSDDNVDSIRKRFHTYARESMPIIQEFEAQGMVRHIVTDKSIDDVWTDVARVMQELDAASSPATTRWTLQVKVPKSSLDRFLASTHRDLYSDVVKDFGLGVRMSTKVATVEDAGASLASRVATATSAVCTKCAGVKRAHVLSVALVGAVTAAALAYLAKRK